MQTRFLSEAAYLQEMLDHAEYAPDAAFSRFMDHSLALYAEKYWTGAGCFVRPLDLYANPDRMMYALSFREDCLDTVSWPVVFLHIQAGKSLQHPHVLGSVLGLGIKRDVIGDIFSVPDGAVVVAEQRMGNFVLTNLAKVGNETVKVSLYTGLPEGISTAGEETVVQVASFRLDCMLESVLHCSRSRAQELIRRGDVKRNWEECLKTDRQMNPGDVLSIRGFGRICFLEETGVSKKGRHYIRVSLFHN